MKASLKRQSCCRSDSLIINIRCFSPKQTTVETECNSESKVSLWNWKKSSSAISCWQNKILVPRNNLVQFVQMCSLSSTCRQKGGALDMTPTEGRPLKGSLNDECLQATVQHCHRPCYLQGFNDGLCIKITVSDCLSAHAWDHSAPWKIPLRFTQCHKELSSVTRTRSPATSWFPQSPDLNILHAATWSSWNGPNK